MISFLKKQHHQTDHGSASGPEQPPPIISVTDAPITPAVEVSGDSSSDEDAVPTTVRVVSGHALRQGVRLMMPEELHAYHCSNSFWNLTSESSPKDYTSDDSEGHSCSFVDMRPPKEIIDLSSDSELWFMELLYYFDGLNIFFGCEIRELVGMN